MSIDTTLSYFRREQATQLTEEATVTRPAGDAVFDRATEAIVETFGDVCDGPCKIRSAPRATGQDVQAGQREVVLAPYEGRWPVDTPLRENDVVQVTASTYDADLATATFRVTDVRLDGRQVARIVGLERTPAVVAGGGS